MLFPEGFAMLNAVIQDFSATTHEIVTTLDSRLKPFQNQLQADKIVELQPTTFIENFNKELDKADAVLLIAPESNNTLYNLTKKVEEAGKELLGSSSEAIKIASDKTLTHKKALDAHVLVPSAIKVGFSEKAEIIDKICIQIGYPVVFKPIDGVGGAGISIVANLKDISEGITTVQKETTLDAFQIQKYINGLDVSISTIASRGKIFPLSLNAQLVRLSSPGDQSEYRGGYLPIEHHLLNEAFENSRKILESIEGLQGYVGLDFVFSYAPFLIEINPRITTSYLGLREVLSQNPAQLILDAHQGKPPRKVKLTGATVFSKIELKSGFQRLDIPQRLQGHIKISSPPFQIHGKTISFIVAIGNSIKDAQQILTDYFTYLSN